jgi:hypothetical protein
MLPGFTAQAALQEPSGRYRMRATAEKTPSALVPAAPCCEGCESGPCMSCEETGSGEDCRWCRTCFRWCVWCGEWW